MITATVADILKKKGSTVITVGADDTVHNALELMVRHNVGALIVTTAAGICGIFTERDYLRKVALTALPSKNTKVMDISTCNVVAVDPSYTVSQAMAVMTSQRCRHLPVMDGGQLVGLVSIGDLVKQASDDQDAAIHLLTDYVTGKYPG
jgi:CBS domain-containing protein